MTTPASRPGAVPGADDQPMDLKQQLQDQEQRLQFDRFTNDDAWRLGSLLVQLAREGALAVTIDIRRSGQQLFHCALPGTTLDNDTWIERKNRVVERYGRSSFHVGQLHRDNGTTFEEATAHLDRSQYAAHGGAFPIRVRDVGVVGTVTVSGLPQAEDHALVVKALEHFLSQGADGSAA